MNKVSSAKNIKHDYESGEILTNSMNNYDYVKDFKFNSYKKLRNLPEEEAKEEYNKINCLDKSHIKSFTDTFGKQDFIYKNEYNMYAWLVEHNGCEAIIFSGEGYGTTVEILLNENNEPKGSVESFFDAYLELIKKF
jgi:hypothetical protein